VHRLQRGEKIPIADFIALGRLGVREISRVDNNNGIRFFLLFEKCNPPRRTGVVLLLSPARRPVASQLVGEKDIDRLIERSAHVLT